jgi:N-acyl amino acid synthase of PEP-CTERM/exosortase system
LLPAKLVSAPLRRFGEDRDRSPVQLMDSYNSMFEAVPATTPELLREVYKLRYQVYCIENHFFDPAENPGGLEIDRYDVHSLHALLLHKVSGAPVGTVRLVLPRPGVNSGSLPLHAVFHEAGLAEPDFLPRGSTAEFSRFAVSKEFRRRLGGELYDPSLLPAVAHDVRRTLSHITLGLMAVALQFAQSRGIDHVCAVMEPALLRLLSRLGIRFTPIGAMVEHHGWRQPCYAQVEQLFATIEQERYDVWEVITERGRYWPPQLGAQAGVRQYEQEELRV